MKTIAIDQAVELIPHGASLMIGGFMGVGTSERVVDEIIRQGKRERCRSTARAFSQTG